MNRLRTKLSLVVGTTLAMAAVASPAAAAPPDFPHEAEASKWSAVRVYDWNSNAANAIPCGAEGAQCQFSDTAVRKQHVELFGTKVSVEDSCTVAGDVVSVFGEVDFTSSSCAIFDKPVKNAQICEHKFTGEVWMRTPAIMGSFETQMYGHLNVSPSNLSSQVPTYYPRGVTYGSPSEGVFTSFNWGTGGKTPAYISVPFNEMWGILQLMMGKDTTVPCAWPELS